LNILDKNWKVLRWHILEAGDVYLLEGVCGIWAVIVEKDDDYLYSCVWLRLEDARKDYKTQKEKLMRKESVEV
jgi:hypothetical protein